MLKLIKILAGTALLALPLNAQETPSSDPFDLKEMSCWDVITLPDDDANFVTAMLIGYKNGEAGSSEFSGQGIVATVVAFDALCTENPEMLAVDAMAGV